MFNEQTAAELVYEDDEHQFIVFSWEEEEDPDSFVQTNQCLIINNDLGYLFDPGGAYVFHEVFNQVTRYLPPERLNSIITTHQDPDVSSSAPYWIKTTPAQLLIPDIWQHFITHLGLEETHRVVPVQDAGTKLTLPSQDKLWLLPAHFLHSEGNLSIYDERSGILFTGDIGASIFPKGRATRFVENFETHLNYMLPFHKRYMHSNKVCRFWVEQVRKLPGKIKMLVPQHGAIIPEAEVENFLTWFENLKCGADYLEEIYTGANF